MLKDTWRLLIILHTLLKARLDDELDLFQRSKLLSFFILPWKVFSTKDALGDRLRIALEELGPIFIKFGQLLSTRPDVIPSEIASSLKKLQDNLPHFSDAEAIGIIERELGGSIESKLKNFESKPIAAASIAQVYSAELKENNREVVLKVVRPGIKKLLSGTSP